MNIESLRLANFKAFGTAQRIPLRPLTLLYGANSAGKSSVLHGLALAHHAVETGHLDIDRTQIGGDSIDLGGFRQYVHGHNYQQQVLLGFDLNSGRSSDSGGILPSAEKIALELSIGKSITSESRYRRLGEEVLLERFDLEVDDDPVLSMSARRGGLLRLDSLDHTHPAFRKVFRRLLRSSTGHATIGEEDFANVAEVLDALVPSIAAERHGLFPRIRSELDVGEVDGDDGAVFQSTAWGDSGEDFVRSVRLLFPQVLREIVDELGVQVEDDIRSLSYLGPLRSYPPRHWAFARHHDSNWHAGGGYAWDIVRNNRDVRHRVNRWLGDSGHLKTPYELEVRDLLSTATLSRELPATLRDLLVDFVQLLVDAQAERLGELGDMAERITKGERLWTHDDLLTIEQIVSAHIDEEEFSQSWVQKLARESAEAFQDLVLSDKRTGTRVSHRDVGIGVSQVLPVLVSSYANEDTLLAVEQPEIHLHPAVQAELGDVFLESALGRRNNFLIETHSEHILLRIMRRIRETDDGNLPDGSPAVFPKDVMVLFVEPEGHGSIIREMPLNERGELVKAWPGGFFEEGMREIF